MKKKVLVSPLIIIILVIIFGVGIAGAAIYLGSNGDNNSLGINLQKGLVGHWNFNGDAKDSSPYGNNGTLSGDAVITAADRKGQTNKAISFNGAGNVNVPDADSLDLSSNITVSAWVKLTDVADSRQIVNKNSGGDGNADPYYFAVAATTGKLYARWGNGSSSYAITGTTAVNDGVWHHVVLAYDTALSYLYLDGASNATPVAKTYIPAINTAALTIGTWGNTWNKYVGQIDDVRIYNRTLSATEVKALYNEYDPGVQVSDLQKGLVGQWKFDGDAKDSSPYENNGTATGTTNSLDRKSQAIKAYNFNGTTDVVTVSSSTSLSPTTAVTIGGWVLDPPLTGSTNYESGIKNSALQIPLNPLNSPLIPFFLGLIFVGTLLSSRVLPFAYGGGLNIPTISGFGNFKFKNFTKRQLLLIVSIIFSAFIFSTGIFRLLSYLETMRHAQIAVNTGAVPEILQNPRYIPATIIDNGDGSYRINMSGERIDVGTYGNGLNPFVKLNRWGNTSFVELSYLPAEALAKVGAGFSRGSLTKNKISTSNADQTVEVYPLDNKVSELGAIEFNTILKKKPATNVFTYSLNYSDDVQFYYQHALTAEEAAEGITQDENAAGSYAVYSSLHRDHILGQVNYAIGKIGHIFRPLITDAKGKTIWGELNIQNKKLTVTVDSTWLANATYPVVVDPTFGYTSTPVSDNSAGNANYILANTATYLGGFGTGTSMSAYVASPTSKNVQMGVYDNAATGNLITNAYTGSVAAGASYAWKTANFSATPTFSVVQYRLGLNPADNDVGWEFDWGAASQGYKYVTQTFGTWPATAAWSANTGTERIHGIYVTYTATGATIIGKGTDAYLIGIDSSLNVTGYISGSASSSTQITKAWHHVVMTYDGANVKLYVDGALLVTTAKTGAIATNATNLLMAQNMAGKLDDMRVYNRALSASEVTDWYQEYDPGIQVSNLQKGLIGYWNFDGDAKDSTPKSNDGTVSGATLTTDRKGQVNRAYNFNGSSGVITVANFGTQIPTSEITIAVWVKPAVGTGNDDLFCTDPFEPGFSGNRMNIHFPWDTTIHWQFGYPAQGASVALDASWVGVWAHYVFTASIAGNFARIYRNGDQVTADSLGFTNPYNSSTQATLRIGGRAGNPFQGDMDDLRVYNRALSTTEITALYQSY